MGCDMFSVLRESSCATQKVILGFSGGKDSVCLLDLCRKYFKTVYVFNMYFVDHLQMQENYFRYVEDKYKVKILHLPHFELSGIYQTCDSMYTSAELRAEVPKIYFSDVENYLRDFFGCKLFVYGMMACESIERNAMLRNNGGIDYEYNKIYPLAFWNNKKVFQYLKQNKIHLPYEYDYSDRSANNPFIDFTQGLLKSHFPSDWERVEHKFPLAGTTYARSVIQYRRWINGGQKDNREN